MNSTNRTRPTNPVSICLCCAGDALSMHIDQVPYETKLKYTFVPRYHNPVADLMQYCPACEAQRCPNMPGRYHYRTYRFVPVKNSADIGLQSVPIGTVINTVGPHRESLVRA